jgi:plasmid stabilization system protein ParE
MSTAPIIAPAAQTDIETAYHWYESIQVGTGDPFLSDLQAALGVIERTPELYGVVNRRTRAAPLASHKFIVYYRIDDGRITVTAVRHASGNPRTWQRRP